MSPTQEQRLNICAAARSYLGVPWRGHGRDHLGIDCVGVVECAYIEAGLPLERTPATYRGVDSKLLLAVLHKFWRTIPLEKAGPADIVLYGVPWAAHLAMLLPSPNAAWRFNGIHCPINGKVVESRFDFARGDIRGIYTWA